MSDTSLPPGPVRAAVAPRGGAVVASSRPCPVCGQAMTGRRTSACSDKCRATKSRRQRVPIPVDKYRDILASLTAAKATLEKYGLQDLARTRSR